jgi:isopropylmalate/homocitrate/citramalate synthase
MHQEGLLKDPAVYEPYPPALVGAEGWDIVLGRHSGRGGLRYRLQRLGIRPADGDLDRFFRYFKRWAAGHSEATDEDLLALWERFTRDVVREDGVGKRVTKEALLAPKHAEGK